MAVIRLTSGRGIACRCTGRPSRRGWHTEGHLANESSGVLTELAHTRRVVVVGIWASLCRLRNFLGDVGALHVY